MSRELSARRASILPRPATASATRSTHKVHVDPMPAKTFFTHIKLNCSIKQLRKHFASVWRFGKRGGRALQLPQQVAHGKSSAGRHRRPNCASTSRTRTLIDVLQYSPICLEQF